MLIESRRTGEVIPGRHSVASALLEIEDARRLLTQVLGVGEPDASTWKKSLVEAFEAATSLNPGPDGIRSKALDWENFWLRLRSAPVEVAKNFLTDIAGRSVGPRRHMIKVRREDGNWVDWHRTCLPGGVIKSKDDPQNRALAVDSWHLPMDMELFETLGVGQKPKKMIQETAGSESPELDKWVSAADRHYRASNTLRSSPQKGYLRPLRLEMPSGWRMLPLLKGAAKSRLSRALRDLFASDGSNKIEFGHLLPGLDRNAGRWFGRCGSEGHVAKQADG